MGQILASFYKFVTLPDVKTLRGSLLALCKTENIKGTILLAEEGINANISGVKESIDKVINFLQSHSYFEQLEIKKCEVKNDPFYRLKVKIKKEIITFEEKKADPNNKVGTYVKPKKWNELISNPEVTVIDTRNEYEVKIGTFHRAKNPHIESFTEFKDYLKKDLNPDKNKKVALFCTGGIRCEKVTSLMLSEGFKEVYHLEGGILKYLAEIPEDESLWEGECFVFDRRVSVKEGLELGSYQLCPHCGAPIPLDANPEDYEHNCK